MVPDNINWNNESIPVEETLMSNAFLLDKGLKGSFEEMSSQAAGELGAFNTPDSILHFESLAIFQDRLCQLETYSEYRDYCSLSQPTHFEDITSDTTKLLWLKKHYKSAKDVDFYIGLFAEDTLPNSS